MFGRLTRELARLRRLVSILELVDYYLLKWNLSLNSDNKVEPTGLPVMRLRPMNICQQCLTHVKINTDTRDLLNSHPCKATSRR